VESYRWVAWGTACHSSAKSWLQNRQRTALNPTASAQSGQIFPFAEPTEVTFTQSGTGRRPARRCAAPGSTTAPAPWSSPCAKLGDEFRTNHPPTAEIVGGEVLIVIGETQQIAALRSSLTPADLSAVHQPAARPRADHDFGPGVTGQRVVFGTPSIVDGEPPRGTVRPGRQDRMAKSRGAPKASSAKTSVLKSLTVV
jgi:hypothetical protein